MVFKDAAGLAELVSGRRCPEAVVAHLDEALRQHVLEKPSDELLDAEGDRYRSFLPVFGTEGHPLPVVGEDALGNGARHRFAEL